MGFRQEPHRFTVTLHATVGSIGLLVTHDTIRHRREIGFAGRLRRIHPAMTRKARVLRRDAQNRPEIPKLQVQRVIEVRDRRGRRFLDRHRFVAAQARLAMGQIIVFGAGACGDRCVARDALQLQLQMRPVRKSCADRGLCDHQERYRL